MNDLVWVYRKKFLEVGIVPFGLTVATVVLIILFIIIMDIKIIRGGKKK